MRLNYIDNCDCMEGLAVIPDSSVDLIVTDPPYRLVSGGCTSGGIMNSGFLKSASQKEAKAGKLFPHNSIAFAQWIPEIYRVLKPGSHCYIMTRGRNLYELQESAKKARFTFQNLLVWDKGNTTPNKWYMFRCEFILMLRKGRAKNINNMGSLSLLSVPNPVGKKVHPTQKPVELMKILIENSTEEGEAVLDPFMGSGTTAIACIKAKRNFIGFEVDEHFCAIAKQRVTSAMKEVLEGGTDNA